METPYDVMAPFHASSTERDAALSLLRREDPIHWDSKNQWWLVTRHEDVREISRRPELFSSEPRGPWHVFEYHFSMQAMDGEALEERSVQFAPTGEESADLVSYGVEIAARVKEG